MKAVYDCLYCIMEKAEASFQAKEKESVRNMEVNKRIMAYLGGSEP